MLGGIDDPRRELGDQLGTASLGEGRCDTDVLQLAVVGVEPEQERAEQRPVLGRRLVQPVADDGQLQHVGVAASFTEARRAELVAELAPLVVDAAEHPWGQWRDAEAQAGSRLPGGQSRMVRHEGPVVRDAGADPGRRGRLRAQEGDRFRHTAQFKRWRDDREPESCTYEQLEEVANYDLAQVLT